MPPAKSKKASAPAQNPVIELGEITPVEDATAERLQGESKKLKEAFLGYAKVDLLALNPTFGRWNMRKVVEHEVTKMVRSLKEEGIQRYVIKNLIPLAIPKASVDLATLTKEGGDGGDLFALLGVEGQEIYACGGQHRRAALQSWRDEISTEIAGDRDQLKKLEDLLAKNRVEEAEVNAMRDRIGQKKRQLKLLGMWGVAVYDLGEFSDIFVY